MPTIISHPAIVLAVRPFFRMRPSTYVIGGLCSILPDIDVLGFGFGIHYGDVFGHRGFTHSLFFAALVSFILSRFLWKSSDIKRLPLFLFLFCCLVSHGVLDAFTDGGLGIAFFSPVSNVRYFFPWRPLEVSPIGLADFLSGPALQVLKSELIFVWLPCIALFVIGILLRRK